MSETDDFFELRGEGIDLFIRLTPKAASDRIDGVVEGAGGRKRLCVRVRAVPEKGKANAALAAVLASAFGCPARDVKLIAGQTSRLKTVRIAGAGQELAARARSFAKG